MSSWKENITIHKRVVRSLVRGILSPSTQEFIKQNNHILNKRLSEDYCCKHQEYCCVFCDNPDEIFTIKKGTSLGYIALITNKEEKYASHEEWVKLIQFLKEQNMHFDLDEIQNENVTSPFESLVDTLDKPEFKQFNYKYQSQAVKKSIDKILTLTDPANFDKLTYEYFDCQPRTIQSYEQNATMDAENSQTSAKNSSNLHHQKKRQRFYEFPNEKASPLNLHEEAVQDIIDDALHFLEPNEENLNKKFFTDEVHRLVMEGKFRKEKRAPRFATQYDHEILADWNRVKGNQIAREAYHKLTAMLNDK